MSWYLPNHIWHVEKKEKKKKKVDLHLYLAMTRTYDLWIEGQRFYHLSYQSIVVHLLKLGVFMYQKSGFAMSNALCKWLLHGEYQMYTLFTSWQLELDQIWRICMEKDCIVCNFGFLHATDLLLELWNGLWQTLSHAKFELPTFFTSLEIEHDRIRRISMENGWSAVTFLSCMLQICF